MTNDVEQELNDITLQMEINEAVSEAIESVLKNHPEAGEPKSNERSRAMAVISVGLLELATGLMLRSIAMDDAEFNRLFDQHSDVARQALVEKLNRG